MKEKRVKSCRVPDELAALDMPGVVRELEQYLVRIEDVRDMERSGKAEPARELQALAVEKLGQNMAKLVAKALNTTTGE